MADSAKAIAKDKSRRRLSEKLGSFAGVLERNEAWKMEKGWKDLEDLYADALALPSPAGSIWTYGFYDASVLQQKVLRHLCAAPASQWFIPYEDHPAFEYAKPFVAWAKALGKVEQEASYAGAGSGPLGRLQQNLFLEEIPRRPRGRPPPSRIRT